MRRLSSFFIYRHDGGTLHLWRRFCFAYVGKVMQIFRRPKFELPDIGSRLINALLQAFVYGNTGLLPKRLKRLVVRCDCSYERCKCLYNKYANETL